MNRVIIINLNGNAYQLEESGYDALRVYLDNAARRLEGNPDKEEIIADIEQAIAAKFRGVLGVHKTVVTAKEVAGVIDEMGPVQDGSATDENKAAGYSQQAAAGAQGADHDAKHASSEAAFTGSAKRFYAIREGAMLAGVCNGIAAYVNLDVTIIRILFIALTLFWGAGALVYLLMAFIVPTANTSAEKAAAYGAAATTQEFIRRAKNGYYEGMKTFQDKNARREWKRKFKQDVRNWQKNFQHQVHQSTTRWQEHQAWQRQFAYGSPLSSPFFWLINTVISVVAVLALYSLVTHGVVFGIALPAGIPLWIGMIAIIVIWHGVAWPFRAMQWGACSQGGGGKCTGPCGALGDFITGIAFLVLVVWLLDRYVPQFHEMLREVPPLLHHALDSAQRWLERH